MSGSEAAASVVPETGDAPPRSESLRVRRLLLKPEVGALAGAVAVWVFFALIAGDRGFLNARGTASYLEVAAELGILAVFVALLMIGGEFDLSLGSTIGASGTFQLSTLQRPPSTHCPSLFVAASRATAWMNSALPATSRRCRRVN